MTGKHIYAVALSLREDIITRDPLSIPRHPFVSLNFLPVFSNEIRKQLASIHGNRIDSVGGEDSIASVGNFGEAGYKSALSRLNFGN